MTRARGIARPAVLLFAKAPVPGRVKTRLTPAVQPDAAAELQRALLLDTAAVLLEAVAPLGQGAALYCAAAEPVDEAPLRALLPRELRVVPQGPGGLGERLARVFGELLARHPAALALGADCPDLTPAVVRGALAALGRSPVVLGAAEDGGYWAIGLTAPWPELFRDIPWSTPGVLQATRVRLAELGLGAEGLPELRDLDRLEDVMAWAARPNPAFPRTLAWCRARGMA